MTEYTYDTLFRITEDKRNYEDYLTGSLHTAKVSYSYANDRLAAITYGGNDPVAYALSYGLFGNLASVTAGGSTLITNSYAKSSSNPYYDLASSTYGNGDTVSYTYDPEGKPVQKTYASGTSSKTVSYIYDNEGRIGLTRDSESGIESRYLYDLSGRLVSAVDTAKDASGNITRYQKTVYAFDERDNISSVTDTVGSSTTSTVYTWDSDNRPLTAAVETYIGVHDSYDSFGRLSSRDFMYGDEAALTTDISYYNPTSSTTSYLPEIYQTELTRDVGKGYRYEYDLYGNIQKIWNHRNYAADTYLAGYHYDKLGQLVREDSATENCSYTYTYDQRGNLIQKNKYALTPYDTAITSASSAVSSVTYSYQSSGWRDILIGKSVTEGGVTQSTVYTNDQIGSRTSDGTWSYSWKNGRQLSSMSTAGSSIAYTYGADGLRLTKSVSTGGAAIATEYYYRDSLLVGMKSGSDRLHFYYDGSGSPFMFTVNGGLPYYYVKNAQGDIVAISNFDGYIEVHYSYDAWGRLLGITGESAADIGQLNPLRYRGYVYDPETGLYYLQSRYYDPEMGRFVNADVGVFSNQMLQGFNVFQYCKNNPINMLDSNGFDAIWIQEAKSASGLGHSGLLVQDENEDWFYLFWGPSDEADVIESLFNTPNDFFFEPLGKTDLDLSITENVISFIDTNGSKSRARASMITSTKIFYGDYTKTYEYANQLGDKNYSGITNNCLHNNLAAFRKSDYRFNFIGNDIISKNIPNAAYSRVLQLSSSKNVFPVFLAITYWFK